MSFLLSYLRLSGSTHRTNVEKINNHLDRLRLTNECTRRRCKRSKTPSEFKMKPLKFQYVTSSANQVNFQRDEILNKIISFFFFRFNWRQTSKFQPNYQLKIQSKLSGEQNSWWIKTYRTWRKYVWKKTNTK